MPTEITGPYPFPLDLRTLDGPYGFVYNGVVGAGEVVVGDGGDVDGNGLDDVIMGMPDYTPSSRSGAGAVFVSYGGDGTGADGSEDLSALDGSNGYVAYGLNAGDGLGTSVAIIGDQDGDGYAEAAFGAPGANTVYVVYGKPPSQPGSGVFPLSSIDGSNGYMITGANIGSVVTAAGDVDHDGHADMVITTDTRVGGAETGYVLYGNPSFRGTRVLNLTVALKSSDGFSFVVPVSSSRALPASSVGDINQDNYGDVSISGLNAVYVLFGGPKGSNSTTTVLTPASLTGLNGFVVQAGTGTYSTYLPNSYGSAVGGGDDLNGDRKPDMLMGDPVGTYGGVAGVVTALWGKSSIGNSGSLTLAPGGSPTGTFFIRPVSNQGKYGSVVKSIGDCNGDGIGDVAFGLPGDTYSVGSTQVVFGSLNFTAICPVIVYSLNNNSSGIVMIDYSGQYSGSSLGKVGYFNNDSFADFIIGTRAGVAYMIFGHNTTIPAILPPSNSTNSSNSSTVTPPPTNSTNTTNSSGTVPPPTNSTNTTNSSGPPVDPPPTHHSGAGDSRTYAIVTTLITFGIGTALWLMRFGFGIYAKRRMEQAFNKDTNKFYTEVVKPIGTEIARRINVYGAMNVTSDAEMLKYQDAVSDLLTEITSKGINLNLWEVPAAQSHAISGMIVKQVCETFVPPKRKCHRIRNGCKPDMTPEQLTAVSKSIATAVATQINAYNLKHAAGTARLATSSASKGGRFGLLTASAHRRPSNSKSREATEIVEMDDLKAETGQAGARLDRSQGGEGSRLGLDASLAGEDLEPGESTVGRYRILSPKSATPASPSFGGGEGERREAETSPAGSPGGVSPQSGVAAVAGVSSAPVFR